jgi:hypothetical protein
MNSQAFEDWLRVDERFRRVIEEKDQAGLAEEAAEPPARLEPDGRPAPPRPE